MARMNGPVSEFFEIESEPKSNIIVQIESGQRAAPR
jgi:hypothetical protein